MSCSEKDFVSTYNQYVDMIYRLCFSFLKNKEDTEDAVQSVFVKYLKIEKKFENHHHEKAWFIVTSSNICKDMLRQSWRRNISVETYDFIPDTEDPTGNEVYMAIWDLPYKYKTVVYLYYYEGYKTHEIAEILHKPSSTIRNHLTEARRHLKKILGGNS
ncbi:MAG: RNA polymerase sigma factor [Lachnospiraceae bacterium]|nr:RNA polymerase sigma factor [Lachnospiraceae bacterium]